MKIQPGTPVRVSFEFSPGERIGVGRLALERGVSVFEFEVAFAKTGLQLSPFFDPPLNAGLVLAKNPRAFDGLHGVFGHSLPDAWGRMLVRRRAEREGVPFASLTALDQLAIVGRRGPGALLYEPETASEEPSAIDLDVLATSAIELIEGHETLEIDQLERLGGSSGGARPKILAGIDGSGALMPGDGALPPGFEHWIIKFRSSQHDVDDIGPLEAAYADMARAAGLTVSETRLVEGRRGRYFATKRFDRLSGNGRVHMLSAAALLDTAWQEPSMGYDTLMRLARRVVRSERAVEDVFRRMVFNVLAHNRDDHANQHAFLMRSDGVWSLAPAFDLTFSRGSGAGEHYMDVAGRGGDDITHSSLGMVAKDQGIPAARVATIVDEVRGTVADFASFARAYEVLPATSRAVEIALQRGLTRFAPP